jgi:hypothetical protein
MKTIKNQILAVAIMTLFGNGLAFSRQLMTTPTPTPVPEIATQLRGDYYTGLYSMENGTDNPGQLSAKCEKQGCREKCNIDVFDTSDNIVFSGTFYRDIRGCTEETAILVEQSKPEKPNSNEKIKLYLKEIIHALDLKQALDIIGFIGDELNKGGTLLYSDDELCNLSLQAVDHVVGKEYLNAPNNANIIPIATIKYSCLANRRKSR